MNITNNIFSRQLGKKAYELKDHLGNVRVTFSDIKMPTGNISQPFEVDLPKYIKKNQIKQKNNLEVKYFYCILQKLNK